MGNLNRLLVLLLHTQNPRIVVADQNLHRAGLLQTLQVPIQILQQLAVQADCCFCLPIIGIDQRNLVNNLQLIHSVQIAGDVLYTKMRDRQADCPKQQHLLFPKTVRDQLAVLPATQHKLSGQMIVRFHHLLKLIQFF